ncbi:ribonuclease H-like domain-containing protein [Neocallimastix sp. 'constans']
MVNQPFSYYCVIDFEASNEEDPYHPGHGRKDYPSEIIQFPAVLINSSNNCINQVDNADIFINVLDQFESWLSNYTPKPFNNVCFVSDGEFDFNHYLRLQCRISDISMPSYVRSYFDIKKYFKGYCGYYKNIRGMLNYLGMRFEGNNHNGLDDASNIARVVQYFLQRKVLETNSYC